MSISSLTQSHQVFLNYRGEELRHSFVSHLIDAFERHEINFFVDKYELRGKDLKSLVSRIEESRVALAIFSTRYAESSWCMDELVKMQKLANREKLQVIPIFYKVKAIDVREQRGEFGDNFWKLAKTSSGDQIKNWKDALECISYKMGLSLKDKSSEADFIKEIIMEVERVIRAIRTVEREDDGYVNHFRNKKKFRNYNCTYELPVFKNIKTKTL
ncbi:Disease resistance protein RBA1 [Cardamine amara subsp. amara]|uniref:Disease resistance protein RBA1 n=1 Tax=Cardamine amara subsp. amara TaxID=228776 RepID=A0ABD1C908_CARAN